MSNTTPTPGFLVEALQARIEELETEVDALKHSQAQFEAFLPLLNTLQGNILEREIKGPHDKLNSGRSRGDRCCTRTSHFRRIFSDPGEHANLQHLMQKIEDRAKDKHGNGAGEDDCWITDHTTEDKAHYVKATAVYYKCVITGEKSQESTLGDAITQAPSALSQLTITEHVLSYMGARIDSIAYYHATRGSNSPEVEQLN